MKTFLTILTAVVIAVGVTQLIRYHERKPDSAGNGGPGQNFVHCGLDSKGHIVPDGRGGCIPPPPTGYIIDVPIPEGAVIEKYPVKHAVPTEELERACPWKAPVSEAYQSLFILPSGVSCIGKPFNICMGGEKP